MLPVRLTLTEYSILASDEFSLVKNVWYNVFSSLFNYVIKCIIHMLERIKKKIKFDYQVNGKLSLLFSLFE